VQTTLPLGSIIRERYVIEDLLGMGGSGAVYLVRDRHVKSNLYALKEVIDPNKEERARFTFEGEILKRLDHPALPRVYRTFDDDKNARAYMLLDYIEGPNLEKLRNQQLEKRFSLPQTIRIMAPIFDAVGYLHKQHPPIIHRDVKPANIIVPTGGGETVLVDFGIAKEYEQGGTTTAIRRCSPGYGAPEQYARGTNPRTDIYGLGATFYTLVTGQVPVDALYRITHLGSGHADPLLKEFIPQVPQYLADAITHAMAINSNDRFASVEEFWQALNVRPIKNEALPAPVVVPTPIARLHHVGDPNIAGMPNDPGAVNSRQKSPHSKRKRATFVILGILIALCALLAGSVLGGVINLRHEGAKITPSPAQNATTASAASRTVEPSAQPGVTPTVAVTPTPVPTPTPVAPNYPRLVNSYQGSIIDKFTQPPTSSTMSLSQVKQNETNITGSFAVGPGLIGNGDFTGTVSTDNNVQFTVAGYQGLLPLFFQGQIHKDGSISGTYCSYQNNQCDYGSGGYGDWNVAPSSFGS
jgi:eukaryotic-like serine/threonine-protein kinase